MIQRKHTFFLRIPWLFAPSSRVSKSEDRSNFSSHSDTNVPIQRPTSSSNFEPQKNSPSHHTHPTTTTTSVIIESSVPSCAGSPSCVSIASSSPKTWPKSPFHLALDGIIQVGKSPSEERFWPASSATFEQEKEDKFVSKESIPQEAEPKMSSPLKSIAKSSLETTFQPKMVKTQPQDTEQKASSVPNSTLVSKTESASNQSPPPPSPSASELTSKALNLNADESVSPASLDSQEEKEMLVPQEVESKEKSQLKAITKSSETSFRPENMSKQPQETEQSASSKPSTPISKTEPASDQPPNTSFSLTSTQSKLLESQEKDKKLHEPFKARKTRDIRSIGQPIQHSMEFTSSRTKDKDPFTTVFRADKKQHEARETVARRLVFATSKLRERDIKFMSSADQITRTVSNILEPEKSSLQNGIKKDVSEFVHKFKQLSAITLAGENRGATMQLGSDVAKKDDSFHIHHDYKDDPEENSAIITDLEGNTKKDSHCLTKDDHGIGKAYINNNVQSINNSLMVHGSVTESG